MDAQLNWLDMPEPTPLRTMVHARASVTEVAAAEAVRPKLNHMHATVRAMFRLHGPMTDETLERLPALETWAPSTARKRRSELYQAGELVAAGEATNSRGRKMILWCLA
jgi:hypothetical protein